MHCSPKPLPYSYNGGSFTCNDYAKMKNFQTIYTKSRYELLSKMHATICKLVNKWNQNLRSRPSYIVYKKLFDIPKMMGHFLMDI